MPMTSKTAALSCAAIALVAGMALRSAPARAEGSVVVYCGVNEEWCRAAASAFQEKTGIHVDMTRQSAGEIFARLRAEKDNPRGDIWYGGTGDPHLQAAADGLTEPYKSPAVGQLRAICATGRRTRPSAPATARSGCISACSASATTSRS